jgi:hypothetical protein
MNDNQKQASKDVKDSIDNFIKAVSSVKDEDFDTVPFEGSWTAGQTAEHILKSNVTKLLYGETEKTERDPGEKIDTIKNIFLNFETKMTAPEFNTPTHEKHDKSAAIRSLEKMRDEAVKAAEELQLSEICLGFELPNMGRLTGLEWLYFMAYHVQRHTHQLNNISNKLKENFSKTNS